MGTLANREDPGEMPRNSQFSKVLGCLQRQNRSPGGINAIYFKSYHL